jgi:23S rRNA (cytosine1962-C5)-methyltransferase
MLPNEGLLSTYCCSHHVSTGEFRAIVLEAAVDAKRTLCQVAFHQQPPDHPVLPALPETEYLRGYTFEMLAAF